MVTLKIKGLVLDQHLYPNSDVHGFITLSRGKENLASDNDDNVEEDVSISAHVRQFTLQSVTLNFIKDLREGDPTLSYVTKNDLIHERTDVVLKLDSDMSLLFY